MKLVQLTKLYWPDNGGGIARVVESIAAGFSDWQQRIITCQKAPGIKKSEDEFGGVPVTRCRQYADVSSTPLSTEYLGEIRRETRDADVVICHHPYPMNDLAILFGATKGKKLIYWWHCDIEQYGWLAKVYAPLVRHSLKKADAIIASSEGNIVNSKLVAPFREKCHVIPFAVSDEYFEEGAKYCEKKWGKNPDSEHDISGEWIENNSSEEMVSDRGMKDGLVHILFLGRMVWYKGCEYLLRAFSEMDNKNCTLTLVGGGPLEEELRTLSTELGIVDRVEFTGMVSEEEKMERIKACDFMVLPSISKAEAFALVQIECMAFGKPIINTNLPSGVPYVSLDGKTGITLEPENVEQLRDAMDRMVSDGELRDAYGKAARKMVEERYVNEAFVREHRELVDGLI